MIINNQMYAARPQWKGIVPEEQLTRYFCQKMTFEEKQELIERKRTEQKDRHKLYDHEKRMIHEAPNCTVKDLWREGAINYKISNEREGTYLVTILISGQKAINELGTHKEEVMEIQPHLILNYYEDRFQLRQQFPLSRTNP